MPRDENIVDGSLRNLADNGKLSGPGSRQVVSHDSVILGIKFNLRLA